MGLRGNDTSVAAPSSLASAPDYSSHSPPRWSSCSSVGSGIKAASNSFATATLSVGTNNSIKLPCISALRTRVGMRLAFSHDWTAAISLSKPRRRMTHPAISVAEKGGKAKFATRPPVATALLRLTPPFGQFECFRRTGGKGVVFHMSQWSNSDTLRTTKKAPERQRAFSVRSSCAFPTGTRPSRRAT